ncbi:MAG: nucleotidyl transferase AbiEii/AbiGii toxin family protein [Candidatus Omnitrophica bacterium]|nr:nucleotidyl transferase AbiEii/AbiGii toxin family protein [Candidatus Omnitrophota bacterium]
MAKKILTPLQEKFISLLAKNKTLTRQFYLTGGTALAAYYFQHRYSEDLDFFSLKQIDILALNIFLKKSKSELQIQKIDFQQSFNRNLFFLHTKKDILKVEFTYFPFELIERPILKNNIPVDSITDIAANKTFTVYQNPRARDFIDLYFILKRYKKLSFPKLIKLARSKFDSQIDPIQLGAQLIKARDIQDLPRMLVKIEHSLWRNFFFSQAKSLSKQIFK